MNDLLKPIEGIIETFNIRLKNPFIFSYIIGWLIFNWKGISIFIFSDLNIEERINCIETNYSSLLNSLLFPLLIAIFYVVLLPSILPYFSAIVDFLSDKGVEKRKNNINQSKINDIKRQLLYDEEMINYENQKSILNKVSSSNNIIDNLRSDNFQKDEIINEQQEELKLANNKINELQVSVNDLLVQNSSLDIKNNTSVFRKYIRFMESDVSKYFTAIYNLVMENNGDLSKINPSIIDEYINMGILSVQYSKKNKNIEDKKYTLTNFGYDLFQLRKAINKNEDINKWN